MIATAPKLTESGMTLLTRAVAGEQITFTTFVVGDGELAEGQDMRELTALIHPVMTFAITDMDDEQHGVIALTGEFDNDSVTSDFTWRELGIMAHGEDNIDVLYAYSNDGDYAGVIRQLNTDVLTIQKVTMIIAIGEAENVTAVYSPHRQYALAEDLQRHLQASNPHNVTKEDVGLENVPNLAPSDMTVTFEQAVNQDNIATGEKLSVLFGKIKKVFANAISHMNSRNNPHRVTLAQVGGAAASHTHSALDINSGENDPALPVTAGGTGVKTMQALRNAIGINAAIGIYTGDGTVKRGMNLGFVPSAVILCDEWGQVWDDVSGVRGGVAIGAYGIRIKTSTSANDATIWNDEKTALLVGEDTENDFAGFWINFFTGTDAEDSISTNETGVTYHYIAYR